MILVCVCCILFPKGESNQRYSTYMKKTYDETRQKEKKKGEVLSQQYKLQHRVPVTVTVTSWISSVNSLSPSKCVLLLLYCTKLHIITTQFGPIVRRVINILYGCMYV